MGMTYEQYWDADPYLAVAYRKAYKIRRNTENYNAWITGLYVYDAFSVCLSNFFRKKGATKQEYIERPVDIFPITEKEKRKREREEREKVMMALQEMQRAQQVRKAQKGD